MGATQGNGALDAVTRSPRVCGSCSVPVVMVQVRREGLTPALSWIRLALTRRYAACALTAILSHQFGVVVEQPQ